MKQSPELKKAWHTARLIKRRMSEHTGDKYFALEEKLKEQLHIILQEDFLCLKKDQLIKFICLVKSHNGYSDHSFLLQISCLAAEKELESDKINQ